MTVIRLDVLDCLAEEKVGEFSTEIPYLEYLSSKPTEVATLATGILFDHYEANPENGKPFRGTDFFESAELLTSILINKIELCLYRHYLACLRRCASNLKVDWRTGVDD